MCVRVCLLLFDVDDDEKLQSKRNEQEINRFYIDYVHRRRHHRTWKKYMFLKCENCQAATDFIHVLCKR